MTHSTPGTPRAAGLPEGKLAVTHRFYEGLASNDPANLVSLVTEDFVLTVAEGMPHDLGGVYHGPTATDGWGPHLESVRDAREAQRVPSAR